MCIHNVYFNQNTCSRPDIPFADWDTETVCNWIQDLGLEAYVTEAKRWVKNGAHLQQASTHDLEKELGIKNVLHRKKLQLALLDIQENDCGDPYLSYAGKNMFLKWHLELLRKRNYRRKSYIK